MPCSDSLPGLLRNAAGRLFAAMVVPMVPSVAWAHEVQGVAHYHVEAGEAGSIPLFTLNGGAIALIALTAMGLFMAFSAYRRQQQARSRAVTRDRAQAHRTDTHDG